MYFNQPQQVKFWDSDTHRYIGGIAYRNEIICLCCGSIIEINDIYENCDKNIEPIITFPWVDIEEAARD